MSSTLVFFLLAFIQYLLGGVFDYKRGSTTNKHGILMRNLQNAYAEGVTVRGYTNYGLYFYYYTYIAPAVNNYLEDIGYSFFSFLCLCLIV